MRRNQLIHIDDPRSALLAACLQSILVKMCLPCYICIYCIIYSLGYSLPANIYSALQNYSYPFAYSTFCHMEFKQKFNMEDSPPRLVQSLLTGCSNQRQVRTPPQPIISQGITFKDPLHGKHRSSAELRRSAATCPTSFWRLGGSSHCFVTNSALLPPPPLVGALDWAPALMAPFPLVSAPGMWTAP
ncbi:hypothetical protein AMECASPLE_008582 [Ameca splendens]|uniref:Uncharacterized protein n=1 Tax=Ameca splendens TaxID=208324 RepID=A0ABV0YN60_9TELE